MACLHIYRQLPLERGGAELEDNRTICLTVLTDIGMHDRAGEQTRRLSDGACRHRRALQSWRAATPP